MAIESYTTQLERIQSGIAKLETSLVASSSHGGNEVVRQRLEILYERERYLRNQVAEEAASGGVADQPIRVRGLVPL